MTRLILLPAAIVGAQTGIPEMPYDPAPRFALKMPADIHLGEAAGVATNSAGHIFVYTRTGNPTAALGNSRVFTHGGSRLFELDQNGVYLREIGQGIYGFLSAHAVRVDAQGNVYVADQGNERIQVFDNAGTFKSQITNVGAPTALCISRGPHQYLYSSHTGDSYGMDDAAIFKLELDGRIVGKFGKAGKLPKELGLVNALDCRTENQLLVADVPTCALQD